MIHALDNLFFGRRPDGTVRLLKLPGTSTPTPWPSVGTSYPEAILDIDLSPTTWASIMSGVSNRGDIEGRFYVAQAFHMNPEALTKAVAGMPELP